MTSSPSLPPQGLEDVELSPVVDRARTRDEVFLPEDENARRAAEAAFSVPLTSPVDMTTMVPVPVERSKKNMKWREKPSKNLKYVDDNLQIDKICMETAVDLGHGIRNKHAIHCLLYTSPSPRDS